MVVVVVVVVVVVHSLWIKQYKYALYNVPCSVQCKSCFLCEEVLSNIVCFYSMISCTW